MGADRQESAMCRNIKPLFNFDPPANDEEIRGASLQFVRKLSGFTRPSRANEAAFQRAVEEVAAVARTLLDSLVTSAEPRNREVEAVRARARSAERFGTAAKQKDRPPGTVDRRDG
jgi:hypothetical protein